MTARTRATFAAIPEKLFLDFCNVKNWRKSAQKQGITETGKERNKMMYVYGYLQGVLSMVLIACIMGGKDDKK